MRRLMWFTLGYCAAIAASVWLLDSLLLLWISCALFAALLCLRFLRSSDQLRRIGVVCMAGAVVASCCYYFYDHSKLETPRSLDGQTRYLTAVVTDYSVESERGTQANAYVNVEGEKCQIILYLKDSHPLRPGDRVEGEFYLRYTGYGGTNSPTYHQGEGIYLLGYVGELYRVRSGDVSAMTRIAADLKHNIKTKLGNLFPRDTGGFASALMLGDSSGLSVQVDNALQNSGIRHIIAVSGLHVSILIAFLVQLVGRRHWLAALIGIPLLFLFAAVAGFTPSVIRASVMQSMLLLSLLLDREYDPATALSLAVLVILGINPLAITSISFQLSVGCVVGIFLFSSKINRYITTRKIFGSFSGKGFKQKLKRWISSSVSVSLSAMSLTVPFSAYYFGTVCTIGVLSNFLALWVITYIFCGTMVSLMASLIFAPLGGVIAAITAWPMRYVLWIADVLGKIPYASISAENTYVVVWLLFSYIMVLLTLCSKKKRPLLLVSCITVGLCSSILLSFAEVRQDNFRMTVLDVGQGQCIILQSKDDCYIVDCGGASGEGAGDLAARTLQTQGIRHVDGLVLTHYDKDHAGGVEALMAQISVEKLLLPDIEPDDPIRKSLEVQYADRIEWVYKKDYFQVGDGILTLIPSKTRDKGNNSGTSILFQVENCDILITGDLQNTGEKDLLSAIRMPQIDILVAGHHGAEDSTSMHLLHAVRPEAVVISVGKDNAYGHPHLRTLQRLELFDCKVWRTDQNGTIVFRG